MDYNGEEKRKDNMFNKDFYDKMMEVHSDMRYMRQWSTDHERKDDDRYQENNKKIDWVTKVAYLGIGGLMVLQFVCNFIKPYIVFK